MEKENTVVMAFAPLPFTAPCEILLRLALNAPEQNSKDKHNLWVLGVYLPLKVDKCFLYLKL